MSSQTTITTLSGIFIAYERNIALTFPYQSKYFGENNLLRKIFTKLTGIEKFLIINKNQTSIKSALKYIMQSSYSFMLVDEKLFSAAEEGDILKKFEQKIEQSKVSAAEEDAEEVPQESVK